MRKNKEKNINGSDSRGYLIKKYLILRSFFD